MTKTQNKQTIECADPSGRVVYSDGLQSIACWNRGFESRRENEGLSLWSVVCCQLKFSATGRSLIQRSPTGSGVLLCVIQCTCSTLQVEMVEL